MKRRHRLDLTFCELSLTLGTRVLELEAEITRQVGHPFNLNSTQQLAAVLFSELGLAPPDRTRKTSSGHFSTAASVLEELRHAHPVVDKILEHRELSKLRSTYTDALPSQVNPLTGCISFSQTGAVTGRLASSDRICRTFPSAPSWDGRSGVPSSPRPTPAAQRRLLADRAAHVAHVSEDQAMSAPSRGSGHPCRYGRGVSACRHPVSGDAPARQGGQRPI
jgi:hypothetical protein